MFGHRLLKFEEMGNLRYGTKTVILKAYEK